MNIEIGEGTPLRRRPNILEEIAYRDTWGKGSRFLHRHDSMSGLVLMRDLLGRGRKYLCAL